jgi:hypothetical protein
MWPEEWRERGLGRVEFGEREWYFCHVKHMQNDTVCTHGLRKRRAGRRKRAMYATTVAALFIFNVKIISNLQLRIIRYLTIEIFYQYTIIIF